MSTVTPSPPVWSHSRLERPSLPQPGHILSSISQVESENGYNYNYRISQGSRIL